MNEKKKETKYFEMDVQKNHITGNNRKKMTTQKIVPQKKIPHKRWPLNKKKEVIYPKKEATTQKKIYE